MGIRSSPHKSESLRANLRQAVRMGMHTGNPPFGYTYPEKYGDIPLVVIEETVVVKELFSLSLRGYSLSEVCILAARKGLRGRNGALSRSSIYAILTNPFYAGMVRLNGEVYSGKHQPIVSLADFEKVNQLLSKRKIVPITERL